MPLDDSDSELPRLDPDGIQAQSLTEREPEPPALFQRERLLHAMVEEIAEKGYGGVSVASVTARAGVPEAVFDAEFAGREECYLAAFDSLLHQLVAHTISAYHAPRESWPERVRAGLATCIAGICARPQAARAYMLEGATIGPATRAHRALAVALFEEAIAEMLKDAPATAELAPATVTGITGGIWRVVEDRLREGRAAELPTLVDGLLGWALAYIPGAGAGEGAEQAATAESPLAGELTAGAHEEIVERDGRERDRELAYRALAPVLGHSARSRRAERC
ncbi:MAG TPA: TetR/AcrR family transcriptional regulator [Solirubrobacteraceae bacterium]|nr:TetR/AcrR family transcriptional regulator [Solirubrobacteraceae bacterium]